MRISDHGLTFLHSTTYFSYQDHLTLTLTIVRCQRMQATSRVETLVDTRVAKSRSSPQTDSCKPFLCRLQWWRVDTAIFGLTIHRANEKDRRQDFRELTKAV
jgi:hypothetical protein